MRVLIFLTLVVTAATGNPTKTRIVGGTTTNINTYPEIVALLLSAGAAGHRQDCGGSILNYRSVLTSANCVRRPPVSIQTRAGSTFANSGGIVYASAQVTPHPDYNIAAREDCNIAIVHIRGRFTYSDVIQPGVFPDYMYHIADNQEVWAAGWGRVTTGGRPSEQLRHVQMWTVNQATCKARYAAVGQTITDNMLCAGWLDIGGRDQCLGDGGGPLYHLRGSERVIVGVTSFGRDCGDPTYPGVNTRVSPLIGWILRNA